VAQTFEDFELQTAPLHSNSHQEQTSHVIAKFSQYCSQF